MKLGEWIKEYRTRHGMSMKDMANVCGLSKAYISMLERGINPTTKKPVSPTIQAFEKIAGATGQDVDSLLKILDDEQSITLNHSTIKFSNDEKKLIYTYRELNDTYKNIILRLIEGLSVSRTSMKMTAV